MSVVVVYFSLDGNTRLLANEVASELRADIVEVAVARDREGDSERWIWADRQIDLPTDLHLNPSDLSIDEYDLIVLGTPVWGGGVAPPIRQFLKRREFFHRRFAAIACYSGRLGRTMREFEELLLGNELVSSYSVREPLDHERSEVRAQVRTWARGLRDLLDEEIGEASGA